jgi:hypothetical protein
MHKVFYFKLLKSYHSAKNNMKLECPYNPPPQGYSSYEIFRLPIIKSFYWVLLEVRRVVKPTGSREFRHHVLWSSRRL